MTLQLTPNVLLTAYSQGVFPMAEEDGSIYWYDPDPRAIIPLDDDFHVPRSLARTIRKGGFEVTVDTAFVEVIHACAEPTAERQITWISPGIIAAYCELHDLGFAHSVEVWIDDELAGGLYGVALGGLFAGESMFNRARDTSKIALVYLVERLRKQGYTLLDTQFITPHLSRFGAHEIPRWEYKLRLEKALRIPARFA